jgi:hypothetical protein
MGRYLREFFWTPSETVPWIEHAVSSLGLWIVVWTVGCDARRSDLSDLDPEMFCGSTEESVQLFLGSAGLSEPRWQLTSGRRQLDFKRSYAVQLVPSVHDRDSEILLQGRLAILRLDQYEDLARAKELADLFRRLVGSMKQQSDDHCVIVQDLANGECKIWKQTLVGKAVPRTETLRLKQSIQGAVVFRIAAP